jgi:hypothetical protein
MNKQEKAARKMVNSVNLRNKKELRAAKVSVGLVKIADPEVLRTTLLGMKLQNAQMDLGWFNGKSFDEAVDMLVESGLCPTRGKAIARAKRHVKKDLLQAIPGRFIHTASRLAVVTE